MTGTLALVTAPALPISDDSAAGFSTGDVIAVFPYSYTVTGPPSPDPTTGSTPPTQNSVTTSTVQTPITTTPDSTTAPAPVGTTPPAGTSSASGPPR